MTPPSSRLARRFLGAALSSAFPVLLLLATAAQNAAAQTSPQAATSQRTYPQSKNAVEKALKQLQSSISGRLPALEGFALAGDHPLNRYQRAYFQSTVQVSPAASGGSVVRVTTKVTAWYTDSIQSRSGYQLLTSNGRLESDLLDQLTDLLASAPGPASSAERSRDASTANAGPGISPPPPSTSAEPAISAPMPTVPDNRPTFSSSLQRGFSPQQLADARQSQKPSDHPQSTLQAEAASLEDVLKSQAHPKNLVAIKKSGTPVVATPSLNGKTLFLASAHDEFEMLDFNADWVHVRISGLSRGWIWRTSLEMPEGISDIPTARASAAPVADLFQVAREETAPFPGDWEPLRGRNVKIISVQKIQESEKDAGAQAKLEFAKSLLDKTYAELAANSQELSGVVLIFDSVDGGMIAATFPTVQAWKAGSLSDSALWHRCYFDPPETFNVSAPASGH
jgi:hypothetical protein